MSRQTNEIYEFSGFRLEPADRLLLRDGVSVQLTPKAFDVLLVLVRNAGRLVTKDELLSTVWSGSFVEEGNLTFTVSALRKALGGEEARRIVETVPKHGYRFMPSVRRVVVDGAEPAPAEPAQAETATEFEASHDEPSAGPSPSAPI